MNSKSTLALIGCNAPLEVAKKLERLGFKTCILRKDIRLPSPVASHADMLLFNIKDRIFANSEYIQQNESLFSLLSEYGYSVTPCHNAVSDKYPNDIAFNVARIGSCLYGNISHNAAEIIDYAKKNGIEAINVKQGYAKCSTVILGDKAIITADSTISDAAEKNGISVLKIENSPSAIHLLGYDYGFLGGACGAFERKIYFVGDISTHPSGVDIVNFCHVYGFETVSVLDGQLTDIGGIIFLPPLA